MDFASVKPRGERPEGRTTSLRPLDGAQPRHQEHQPPPRKRARMACTWCRDRKVRCDVSIHGKPCTNCRLDRHECTLRPTAARGRAVENALMHKSSPAPKMNTQNSDMPTFSLSGFGDTSTAPSQTSFLPNKNIHFTPISPNSIPRNALHPSATDLRCHESSIIFSFYRFLDSSNLSGLPPEDVKFLEMKGSLHIPSRPILDAFVRHYFLHVHPCLPVLNEADFWHLYHNRSDQPNREVNAMSLFVFQAMLFASCAFVPPKVIKAAGFEDNRTARNVLYFRAKFLFDLKAEKNDLAKAQGAVLLTYQSSSFEFHAGSLWLTVAIQNAILCGAHVYESKSDKDLDDPLRNMKKRLWWSILLRDRILPLGLRRYLQITPENFNLALSPMTEEDLADEIHNSDVYDPETKRLLAAVLRVQCELALTLTSVIMTVYSPNSFGQPRFMTRTDFSRTLKEIADCREYLGQWAKKAKTSLGHVFNSDRVHESVTLYSGLTFLYYQAARLALCHFEALMVEIHQVYIGDSHKSLLSRLRDELENASSCITNSVKDFLSQGVARHLPISAIAYTALPLLLNALDVKLSSSTSQIATRKRRLRYYAEVMQVYRDRYDGTDGVAVFIQQALRFADTPDFSSFCQQAQEGNPTESATWLEVFSRKPRLYLRLSLTLDYAFTRGSFPQEADLPALVRELHFEKEESPGAPVSVVKEVSSEPAASLSQSVPTIDENGGQNDTLEQGLRDQGQEQLPQFSEQTSSTTPPTASPPPFPHPPPPPTMPSENLPERSLSATNYFELQGISEPPFPGQSQPNQLPLSFTHSYSESTPLFHQEQSVYQHAPPQTFEEMALNFLNFGGSSPDSASALHTAGVVDGTNDYYQNEHLHAGLDFNDTNTNEEMPMWNDHMLNGLLSAPPT
ncbi:hypothetical protein VTO42DRAFT_6602 [Malbranchea cinnamomea]